MNTEGLRPLPAGLRLARAPGRRSHAERSPGSSLGTGQRRALLAADSPARRRPAGQGTEAAAASERPASANASEVPSSEYAVPLLVGPQGLRLKKNSLNNKLCLCRCACHGQLSPTVTVTVIPPIRGSCPA